MRIAVDAMGGDYAPGEVIKGAQLAAAEYAVEILLVGNSETLKAELDHQGPDRITIVHASEVIHMDDQPALALRRKKNASIAVATSLVKSGEALGLVSAGSTGAQMAAALLTLGRLPGISRPAIATLVPTLAGPKVLLDAGANVDCKPQHLVQFAGMGSIYAEKILGIKAPRVGLLNVGVEITKGNELTLAAYPLLQQSGLNFIGNIEPREIPTGECDVIVCDGFVGNCLLKFGEGLASAALNMLKEEIGRHLLSRMGAALLVPSLKFMGARFDYSEYGGAPLLGVNGVSIVCHGSSRAKAIKNAIRLAMQCVENRFVEHIGQSMAGLKGEE
ncbi:MAG: phosphate acyltransferase PlsX [Clostridia bacterium]|nr:MAG: phosphate acyltransferase PlsX [Clostridia bacterium]